VEIQMSTNIDTWNTLASNADRNTMFRKVALHEMGHVMKLCHPSDVSCTIFSVMQQGRPRAISGGIWEVSTETQLHDANNLVEKWGA
jgi:hypothetical protein